MKKLLLIGGTGFVGSHLSKACAEEYLIESTGREVDVPPQRRLVEERIEQLRHGAEEKALSRR